MGVLRPAQDARGRWRWVRPSPLAPLPAGEGGRIQHGWAGFRRWFATGLPLRWAPCNDGGGTGALDSPWAGMTKAMARERRGQSNQNAIALAGSVAALTTPGTGRTIYGRRCTAYGGMTTPAPDAPWCSGSTSAFGAVSPGSNPGGAATFTTTDQLTWRRRSRLMPPAGILIGCDERTEALLLAPFVGDGFRRLQHSSRRIPLADSLPTPVNRRES